MRIIRRSPENIVYTLIEEREDSYDEETKHVDPSQNRLEDTAEIVRFIFSQKGDIGSRQTRRYQGYNGVLVMNRTMLIPIKENTRVEVMLKTLPKNLFLINLIRNKLE